MFKGTLANRLSIAPGDPGTFWLHSDPETLAAYAREMTAEVWNPERSLWDNPHGRPNHAWDCEYMLQALAWMLNISKRKRPDNSEKGPSRQTPPPMPRPAAKQSIGDKLGSRAGGNMDSSGDRKKLNWRQACAILSCSRSHFYNLINSGKLPAIRMGTVKGVRVFEDDCLCYLKACVNKKIV